MNRGTRGITDTQLELPLFSPGLRLFDLTEFYQQGISPLGQLEIQLILIDSDSAVVFIAAEHELAIVPDLPGIFASQT